MIQSDKHDILGGGKKESFWIVALISFLLLSVFSITTPFVMSWPVERHVASDRGTRIAGTAKRISQGNKKRQAGMATMVVVLIVSILRTRNRFQINGALGWVVIFYLGWILFSISWSIDPLYTMRRVAVVYMMWLAAIIVAAHLSFRQIATLAVLVTGTMLLIGFGNELRLGSIHPTRETWRFSGMFHALLMGQNCGVLVMSTTFLLTEEKRKRVRTVLWLFLIAGCVFLLLTKSRTPVLAGIIAAGFYWSYLVSMRRKLIVIVATVVCLSAAYVVIGDSLLSYGTQATTLGRGESATETASTLTGRIPLWKYSFKYAKEKPLCGYGFTTFISRTTIGQIYRDISWTPVDLHSAYVNELLGTGFIGMSALIAMLVLALTRTLRLGKRMPHYYFISAVIIWAMLLYSMVTAIVYGMNFNAFFVQMCIARLAFQPAEELA